MPRTTNTRQQRAEALRAQIERGPHFTSFTYLAQTNRALAEKLEAEIINGYQLWAKSWVLPELTALIPELRRAEK